jgi:tetratricopeptide (TPR) repeat protein
LASPRAALELGAATAREPLALHEDLAELSLRENDGARALQAALAARARAGDLVKYVLLTGRARWMAGQHQAAVAEFELAAPHAPDRAEAQLPLAMAYAALGRVADAVRVLEAFLARKPHDAAATLLAHCRFDPAAPAAALAEVDAAIARTPGARELPLLRAALRVLTGADPESAGDGLVLDPRQRARWEGFLALRQQGCERFVGLPCQVLEAGLAAATVAGHVAEFGVFGGRSLAQLTDHVKGTVHGFDSFAGLPADFTDGTLKGAYDLGGVAPTVAANCVLHVGDFADTLPEFAAAVAEPARLWHVDCDLYASTKTVFDALGDRLQPGSVVVFDDFVGYHGAELHEQRAWRELVSARRIRYRVIAGALLAREVAVLVESVG